MHSQSENVCGLVFKRAILCQYFTWVIFSRVGLRVEGSLGQEDGVLLGGNTQLIVEGVMPDLQEKENVKRAKQTVHETMKRTESIQQNFHILD